MNLRQRIVAGAGLASIVVVFAYYLPLRAHLLALAERETSQLATTLAEHVGEQIARNLETGRVGAAEQTLESLATEPNLSLAAVLDPTRRVSLATRPGLRGQPLLELDTLQLESPPATPLWQRYPSPDGDSLWMLRPLPRAEGEPALLALQFAQRPARAQAERSALYLAALPLAGLVLGCLLLWLYLGRRVSARLEALATAAQAFARDEQVPAPGRGGALELDDLADAFDAMREHARSSRRALESTNRALRAEIGERERAEEGLQLAAEVFENSHEAILIADTDRRILLVNQAFLKATGYTQAEVLGQPTGSFLTPRHDRDFRREVVLHLLANGRWEGELWHRRKDGAEVPLWVALSLLRDGAGRPRHYVSVATDLSERKRAEERISYLANYDPLTGLPNRALLHERLMRLLEEGEGGSTALVVTDIQRFKAINDSLGVSTGDSLLRAFAHRAASLAGDHDFVARLGGDQFALVLPNVRTGQLAARCQSLLAGLTGEYSVAGESVTLSVVLGVALHPSDANEPAALVQAAETALSHARTDSGSSPVAFFAQGMNAAAQDRYLLERDLRRALAEEEELELWFQPQLRLADGELIGAEALVRWRHPERGLIPPARFVPIAEDSGLISALGDWVLDRACAQAAAWVRDGRPLRVAVNLSALQFATDRLPEMVREVLRSHDLEPRLLQLELTESVLMDHSERAVALLWRLSDLGVQLAVDDFGTGYSSLAYLKRFPIHELKIDQAFVRDLDRETSQRDNDARIVEAIVGLARNLGLKVIAEGVETEAQLSFLARLGCDTWQGHLFSPALPAADFAQLERRGPALGNTGSKVTPLRLH